MFLVQIKIHTVTDNDGISCFLFCFGSTIEVGQYQNCPDSQDGFTKNKSNYTIIDN